MPRLISVSAASGGEVSYTLSAGEAWRLVSVVGSLAAFAVPSELVPTLIVEAPDGAVIAEISAAIVA
jgi:hypothetical protein